MADSQLNLVGPFILGDQLFLDGHGRIFCRNT